MESIYLATDSFLSACFLVTLLVPLLSGIFALVTPVRYAWLTIINAPLLLLVGAVSSVIVLTSTWNNSPGVVEVPWLQAGAHAISANLMLSNTSILMMTVVSLISTLVHLYSIGYMAGDNGIQKYFGMLGLFTFAMQGIVLSDNLLVLFIFWELVGFSSYLLIAHWNENKKAGEAATKAFVMNRIGDVAFLVGLMIVWANASTFEIAAINNMAIEWQTAAGLCIFAGVIGKSAQFPLFTWLPDAMEGPTPVSALIHAATMVAAGVYLLIRLFPFFTETTLNVIAITGGVTALLGAVSALFQRDIKRVLAYSTISQLGLMILTIGMGGWNAAFVHLLTHAFFKAGLFLCAGLVIHSLEHGQVRSQQRINVQDLSNLGGLRKRLPFTFIAFAICGASLAGVPFFSGFLSKEAMYSAIINSGKHWSWIMMVVMTFVSLITIAYTFRLIWLIFMGESRKVNTTSVHESALIMRIPVALLAIGSLWLVVGWNPFSFNGWLFSQPIAYVSWILPFSIALIIVGGALAFFIFRKPRFNNYSFLTDGFKLDQFYRHTFFAATNQLANTVNFVDTKVIDRALHASAYGHVMLAHVVGWFDKFLVDGIVSVLAGFGRWIGGVIRSYQNGKVQDYILWAVIALIIFIIWAL